MDNHAKNTQHMESRRPGGSKSRNSMQPLASCMESRRPGGSSNLHVAVEFPSIIDQAPQRFFSQYSSVDVCRHNLPHLVQPGVVLFVTFRLADSMPKQLLRRWQEDRAAWLSLHPEPWDESTRDEYSNVFLGKVEEWLDAGHGDCALARSDCHSVVAGAIEHFNGERYQLHSYIVMPNHVHVLMELAAVESLPKVIHSWKSFTAKAICRATGKSGAVWQRDYFDRMIRGLGHYRHCLNYIRANEQQMMK